MCNVLVVSTRACKYICIYIYIYIYRERERCMCIYIYMCGRSLALLSPALACSTWIAAAWLAALVLGAMHHDQLLLRFSVAAACNDSSLPLLVSLFACSTLACCLSIADVYPSLPRVARMPTLPAWPALPASPALPALPAWPAWPALPASLCAGRPLCLRTSVSTFGRLVMANRKCTIRRVPFAGLTLGDLDSGLEGAESAKRDETPWSIYDGPLATA